MRLQNHSEMKRCLKDTCSRKDKVLLYILGGNIFFQYLKVNNKEG